VSPRWKLAAVLGLGTALVVEIVLVTPYVERASSALDKPDLRWLSVAVFTELVSMAAFARVQRRMLSAGGTRVSLRRIGALTYAANALSVTFPGGTALSSGYVFKRLRSWGATVPAAGFTIVASGLLSTLAFALLAVVGLAVAGGSAAGSVVVLAAATLLGAAVLVVRRRCTPALVVRVAGRGLAVSNRLLHRSPEAGVAALHRIVSELSAIRPRSRDWLAGLGYAGLNWVADLGCLAACFEAVDAGRFSLVLLLVAYLAGMGTSSLTMLPGGLGPVDAAMIFALTQGGVNAVAATAAVLLYRVISLALVVALGWLIWAATWLADRRRPRSLVQPAAAAARPVSSALTVQSRAAVVSS
jgi:putative heme transporter